VAREKATIIHGIRENKIYIKIEMSTYDRSRGTRTPNIKLCPRECSIDDPSKSLNCWKILAWRFP